MSANNCQFANGEWVTNDAAETPCVPDPAGATGDVTGDEVGVQPRCFTCKISDWNKAEKTIAQGYKNDSTGSTDTATTDTSASSLDPTPQCATDDSGVRSCTEEISRATFKGAWPFTVDHGQLECDQPMSEYFTAPDGSQYGINGTALDAGAKRVDPIWRKDPTGVAPNVWIGDVQDAALKLCSQ